MLRSGFFLLVSVLLVCSCRAGHFDFNANCRMAYHRFLSLRPEEGRELLDQERRQHPDNLIPVYLESYGECLQLLFNGDPTGYPAWKAHSEARLELISKGDNKQPWYRFCKAGIYLQQAMVQMRFGDNFKATAQFRRSFLLLKENHQSFPDFEENKVLLGLEQAMAGAIPDSYKWISSVFGVRGNINRGVASIVAYLNAHPDGQAPLYDEAAIYYCYLKFYLLSGQQQAWEFVNNTAFLQPDNLLRCFVSANLALNYRKADQALILLRSQTMLDAAERYPILHYELGEALLARLDYSCITAYERFIDLDKGKHFVKDAWQKLACVAYLQQDRKRTDYCLQQILRSGTMITDADKQAQRFASSPSWPLRALLEIKLLIDGGYIQKALSRIQAIPKEALQTRNDRLEYNFRYGRIFEESDNAGKAILFYTATVQEGRKERVYFAARAALHMGFIYEKQGNKAEAIRCYKDCLSMRDHDFQSSIDQQAKAGLNRLGN